MMPCCAPPPPPPLLYNTNRCCAWLCPFRRLLIHHVFPTTLSFHWPYEYDNEGETSPRVIRTSLYCVNGVEITYLIVYAFQSFSLPPFFFCIYFEKQVAEWYRVRELSIKRFHYDHCKNETLVAWRLRALSPYSNKFCRGSGSWDESPHVFDICTKCVWK